MVWVCSVAVFPQSSVKVHVLVMIYDPSQEPAVTTSVNVASSEAEQLSASSVTSPVCAIDAS